MEFLRLDDVTAKTKLCKASIYKLMAEGKFPRSANLGGRMVRWSADEIEGWMRARLAEREAA